MQFDEFIFLFVVNARLRRVVHQLRDSQIALLIAGFAGVGQGINQLVRIAKEVHRLAPTGQMAFVITLNEKPPTSGGIGGSRSKCRRVGTDVEASAGDDNGAGQEGMLDAPGEFPAGDIHRVGIGVDELNVLLVLVPGGRIVVVACEVYHGMVRLGVRNERRIRARDVVTVGMTYIVSDKQVPSSHGKVIVLEYVDCVIEGLIPRVASLPSPGPWIRPFQVVTRDIRRHRPYQLVDTVLDEQYIVGCARRLEELIHDGPQPAQVHFPYRRIVKERIGQSVPVVVPLLAVSFADERVRRFDVCRFARDLIVGGVNIIVIRRAGPVRSPCEVVIPRHEEPFAGAVGIAV